MNNLPDYTKNTDSELAEKIQQNDRYAYKELFFRYSKPLVYFLFAYLKNQEDAENYVQDIFLSIWQNRSGLNPESNIKSYLYTSARNKAFKHFRHLSVISGNEQDYIKDDFHNETPVEILQATEISEAIENCIETLPPKTREIFKLSRNQGLKYKEIAEVLGISIKTVEAQMGRALKFMRAGLDKFLLLFFLFFR